MSSKSKNFNTEVDRQLETEIAIKSDALNEILRLLGVAQKEIGQILAQAPTDYQAWYLPQLEQSIKTTMGQFSAAATANIASGAEVAWFAGQQLIDEPLRMADIQIVQQLPRVDSRQLLAMQHFMTNRVQDIGNQIVNLVNSELGLVVIGTQTPFDARSKIAGLFGAKGNQRAKTIVNTELGRVYAVAGQERMTQAAELVPGMQKQWRRSGKIHSRLSHDLIDGQRRDVNQPFQLMGRRGIVQLMHPKDPKAPAGETIHCGCVSIPFMNHWSVTTPGARPFSDTERSNPFKNMLSSNTRSSIEPLTDGDDIFWRPKTKQAPWHNAGFAKSPTYIKKAIKKYGHELVDVLKVSDGAHFKSLHNVIDTDGAKRSTRKGVGTWRHEYGHFLDQQLGGGVMRSSQEDFIRAIADDKNDFLNRSGMGRKSKKQQAILSDNTILNDRFDDKLKAMPRQKRHAYIDSLGVNVQLKYRDVIDALKRDGFTDDDNAALDLRVARVMSAINRQDAASFLQFFTGHGSPGLDRMAVYRKGLIGPFSDLIGSASKNKLGGFGRYGLGGHDDVYYRRRKNIHAAEVFANLTALFGDNSNFWTAAVQSFMPRASRLYKDALQ